jgi:multicomponent Na+:H+ antiporter subunit F
MTIFFGLVIALLLLTIIVGLARVIQGPTLADRLLAVLLFGTTTCAVLLLLAEVLNLRALRDVALVFALLAVVASAAFARFYRVERPDDH